MATFDTTPADDNTAPTTNFTGGAASANAHGVGALTTDAADDNTAPGTSFTSGAASANAHGSGSLTTDAADDNDAGFSAMTNGAATANAHGVGSQTTDGADANVVDGEAAPVAGGTAPDPLTTVAHTTSISAGTNYGVNVVTRAAPVTITLPDPPSENQIVEIRDFSLQARTYPITVDPGTKKIDGSTDDYVLNTDGQVLRLVYLSTLTQWKIV